jgi:hypothetical protein
MKAWRLTPVLCAVVALVVMLLPGRLAAQTKVFGLTLTPEQAEKFRAINIEAEPAKKAIREDASLSESEKLTRMKGVYDGIREKLKTILTPEQLKEMEAGTPAKSAETAPKPFAVFGVTLTPEQAVKFKAINAEAQPKKKALADDKALSAAEKRAQMQAIYKEIKEKLRAILTPEQIKQMDAPATAYPMKREGSASGPAKAFGVTLTPEQAEKFKAINDEALPKKKAIRENSLLSDTDKRAQMLAIYKDIREKLKAILTPEQIKQMDAAPGK